jgi:hypothetical protein
MIKNDINRKYSPTWVYCNDNSRSSYFRKKFIEEHGGLFSKNKNNTFTWEEEKKPISVRRKFIFEDRDGTLYVIDNMYEFCKINDLTRPAMYEMIDGKRKSHKGFKFIVEIPWVKVS